MNKHSLREKTEKLNQRLRILILQNAREGSVYDDRFLFEVRQISDQLLHLRQAETAQVRPERGLRSAGIMPALVAHS